ncbi:MAG: hypothetical protein UX74_C0026G0008 [Parcubacteria group bacterium GW2011_GWA2_47_10b]|nr:MAG: hypothetical protein UX74_C0026G0008 [Parcubacteria group bacterium GW2011_GWA2_47_10b]
MPYEEKGSPWIRLAMLGVIVTGLAIALARLITTGYD